MREESEKCAGKWVQLTLFDLPEEEPEYKAPEVGNLPYFENPRNDNEILFNLQHDYYEGDKTALSKMYGLLSDIAPKVVNIESKKRKLILTKLRMEEVGEEAVMIFVEGVLQKNLVIKKSFIAYLRLQVLRALFYQTKAQKFEKWMIEHNISIFGHDEFYNEWTKECFERELEEEKKEREENKQ